MRPTPRTAIATIIVAAAAAPATAQFHRLDGFPGLSEGISDTGRVAGSFGAPEVFTWTESDGVSLIGGLVSAGGQARISADGMRISGTAIDPDTGLSTMAYYDVAGGTWVTLGGIGGVVGSETSSGWSISGDGDSVVGLGWIGGLNAHAAQWLAKFGAVYDLGSSVSDASSRANAVDFDGDIVAGWQDNAIRQGAVWIFGEQELISLPGGGPAEEASAISSDGRWVTGFGIANGFGTATTYRYDTQTKTTIDIPNLPFGGASRFAGTSISDDGTMIAGGTWGFGPATFGTAVIWREGVGTVRFDQYLDEMGVDYPAGYAFAFVSDMSSDGRWFTGWGNASGGPGNETFVIHIPDAQPCPADVDGSGEVAFDDLTSLLATWGDCDGCPADFDGDGTVGFADLTTLLAAWGPCP